MQNTDSILEGFSSSNITQEKLTFGEDILQDFEISALAKTEWFSLFKNLSILPFQQILSYLSVNDILSNRTTFGRTKEKEVDFLEKIRPKAS